MILKIAWRNIWRNKKRSVITTASILIAVFLSLMMRSVQLGTYKSMIDNVVGSYTGYIQIHENGYWDKRSIDKAIVMTDSLITKVLNTKGVEALLPRLENYGLLSVGDLTKVIGLSGLNFEQEQKLQDIEAKLVMGTLPQNSKDIILGKGVASYFKAGINDTVVFMGQGYHGMLAADKFRVSGIIDLKNPTLNKATALLSLQDAQDLFSANGIATSLVIDKKNNARLRSVQEAISGKLDDNFEIMNWQEMMPELQQTILADSIGGLLMVGILYMILIFGIFGTVLMMTQERKYEFGVLVSIGMKKGKLMLMVFMETIILSLLGVLAGVLFAYPIMLWKHYDPLVLPGTEAEMMETFGFSAEIPFYIQPDLPLVHASLIFSIALLVSLYPITIIKKLRPLEAMRG
ncbi:FtsX-like permease family protein [Muricauda sp. SCSIO 64092]|uniref:ABC transporter permease n=1 Tax=Allomuricauda sp. SCSIO 64092 TaxID=2908842 RepID=UPI001FF1A4FB|nr:FtsX-like permease family protein [Muricauda sp. SCSIO 64092]UOY05492.1 FtsX-like permease family protein [Muricauda sp. SCSIO 64092]